LQFFDVLGHAGVFVVEVVASGELVEAGLGVLALLDLQVPIIGSAFVGRDSDGVRPSHHRAESSTNHRKPFPWLPRM
jgi:hypothetical protein